MAAVARPETAVLTTEREIDLAIAEFGSEMYGLALSITANVPDAEDWDPTVARALTLLSERQRAVVALHYGYGYSMDETAAVLGCRGGTVRSRLARALTALRRSMRDDQS